MERWIACIRMFEIGDGRCRSSEEWVLSDGIAPLVEKVMPEALRLPPICLHLATRNEAHDEESGPCIEPRTEP